MRSLLQVDDPIHQSRSRDQRAVDGKRRKYGILQIAKFGFASGIGFLVAEIILVLGVAASYHTIEVPSLAYSSPVILGLDVLAFGIGVTVAFAINEQVTFNRTNGESEEGRASWFMRWCKYQLSSLLGNVVIVGIQLSLLATISLSPVLGSIVGAMVSYPMTYVISTYFVWGARLFPMNQTN